jgi:NADH:ubiquinone oxidoreductase subunit K
MVDQEYGGPPAAPISVTAPLGEAWRRMVRGLFGPFDLTKWLTLGFCAFLASCGEGVASFNANFGRGGGGRGGSGTGLAEAVRWIENNLILVALLAAAFLVVALALAALVFWLQSRGKFMLLDGLVFDRGAVVEPWRAFRLLANSLFRFKFALAAGGTGAAGIVLAIAAAEVAVGLGILVTIFRDRASTDVDTLSEVRL